MQRWRVVFFYKDHPSYKGTFYVDADTAVQADNVVKIMIHTKAVAIPQNWNDYEIYAAD